MEGLFFSEENQSEASPFDCFKDPNVYIYMKDVIVPIIIYAKSEIAF